jgi:O-antigen/teichoic acid export membrane protein
MNALSIVTGNGLWAIDQPRSNFLADVCCMTATLIAAAILVHPFGALGAALATLAGATAAAVVRSFILMRRLEFHVCETGVAISSALPSQG